MAATAPHYALEQAQDAAHGGEGWRSRQGTTADELGSIWAACGCHLRVWHVARGAHASPGSGDRRRHRRRERALARSTRSGAGASTSTTSLADLYRAHGIAVHELGEVALDRPNSYFCRDVFAMTPVGAILARPASASRAGEERQAAAALARIGVPILHSVFGAATFEGADVAVVEPGSRLCGRGTAHQP